MSHPLPLRQIPGLRPARALERDIETTFRWHPAALRGRWIELAGGPDHANLTWAVALVAEAQRAGEPCAWLDAGGGLPFIDDLLGWGIDPAALAVVVLADPTAAGKAADILLRSGAFGLVVVDLPAGTRWPLPRMTRLAGLTRRHEAILLTLTETPADAPSSGSPVDALLRSRAEPDPEGGFVCRLVARKDRLQGPGRRCAMHCHAPPGSR